VPDEVEALRAELAAIEPHLAAGECEHQLPDGTWAPSPTTLAERAQNMAAALGAEAERRREAEAEIERLHGLLEEAEADLSRALKTILSVSLTALLQSASICAVTLAVLYAAASVEGAP
jgi:hypothetical protein